MNKTLLIPAISVVAAVLAAAGCAQAEDEKKPELTLESTPSVISELGQVESIKVGAGLQRLVDMATQNLAANLKIDESDINLAEAEYVTWRDSSIGCPQPDMQYMQVLTNGSRIVLKANGAIYNYHSSGNVPPTYCSKPSAQKPLPYAHGES